MSQLPQAEVIIVNDGSRDNTGEIVRRYIEQAPNGLRLIENPGNHDKGFSVRNGMLHARGDVMLFSDADLSAPIEECSKLFQAIEEGADVAIGSRWLRPELQTEPPLSWFLSEGVRKLMSRSRVQLMAGFAVATNGRFWGGH